MDMDYIFDYGDSYWIYRWKESENIKSNLTEEQRKGITPEIYKIISVFERPENHNLKFDMKQLKKWIMEYNPKITQDYLEYISNRIMVYLNKYRMKRENPKKYEEFLEKKRKYNRDNADKIRISSKKYYEKMKNNPIVWERVKEQHKKYYAKKYREDPEYRKKVAKYQKEYFHRMKKENPEKYYAMIRSYRRVSKSIAGVRCPHCGFGIKTITSGKNLGKKPIICPECHFSCPKNNCEKIRIFRTIPDMNPEVKKEPDGMMITEKALEGLRNLGNVFEEIEYPLFGTQKRAIENIQRKMVKFADNNEK